MGPVFSWTLVLCLCLRLLLIYENTTRSLAWEPDLFLTFVWPTAYQMNLVTTQSFRVPTCGLKIAVFCSNLPHRGRVETED